MYLSLRVVLINGEPRFLTRDVATALGYARPANAYNAHCKSLKKVSFTDLVNLGFEGANPQGEYLIPEPDVYRLVLKSNAPNAEPFQDWLCQACL